MSIPFVRAMTELVDDSIGRETFTYVIGAVVIACLLGAIGYLLKRGYGGVFGLIWIVFIGSIYAYLVLSLKAGSPEEAIHYVLYAVLSLLLYRALVHRTRDYSIYAAAILIGTLIGTADEILQWLVPERYFDTRDIWLNFTGVALIQAAIAIGIRPPLTGARPNAPSMRRLCVTAACLAAVWGLCHLITPRTVILAAERIPALGFLKDSDDVMFEYGHRYADPEIGVFRSRLSREELAETDASRAQSGARILDAYQGRERYGEFLKTYTALKDPFLHEVRVHLFSRDANLSLAERAADTDTDESRRRYTFAYRQHQILERYFGRIYAASSYPWPADLMAKVEDEVISGLTRESKVSAHLVTSYSKRQAAAFFGALVAGFLMAAWYFGRRGRTAPSETSAT